MSETCLDQKEWATKVKSTKLYTLKRQALVHKTSETPGTSEKVHLAHSGDFHVVVVNVEKLKCGLGH